MNDSQPHSNNDRAPKLSVFAKYKRAIFLLAIVSLSLIVTFLLTNRFQARQEPTEEAEALSTDVIPSPPSAAPTASMSLISPISPVSPVPAKPESTALDPLTVQSTAETGLQMYQSGDYEEALELFNTVVDAEPDNPGAFDARGSIYAALHDYDNALNDYSKAIELNPSFAQAYYNRGRVYRFLKRYDEALLDLEKSVELDPRNFGYRAKGNVGLIYHRLGEYQKAMEAFQASMAYEDSKADVFYFRGETYSALKNYEAAIADYEAAIERFSGYDLAYQGLGYAYYKTSQLDKAAEALNRALEISPNSPAARFYLGLVYLAKDDAASATAEMSQAASSFSTLSQEEQELIYTRAVNDLKAFSQDNPDKAAGVEAMIELIPQPQ